MAAINEETKNVVRKLDNEKRELNLENENLKKRIHDLEKSG
jgi:regulator of replication initiation timing